MSRTLHLMLACCVAGVAAPAFAGDPATADEIITRYISAIGGLDKLNNVQTMRVKGKVSVMGGGTEAPMIQEIKRPNKMRMEFTFQGMTITQAYDGEFGWAVMPWTGNTKPQKLGPDMLEQIVDQAELHGPLVNYKDKGHQVELLGKEDLEGTPAYRLKVTRKSGNVDIYFLDAEYFIPIQVKSKRKVMGNELDFTLTVSDYKEVDGIMMAHSMQQSGGMQNASITIEEIKFNLDMPDERFAMPEAAAEALDAAAETNETDKPEVDAPPAGHKPAASDG